MSKLNALDMARSALRAYLNATSPDDPLVRLIQADAYAFESWCKVWEEMRVAVMAPPLVVSQTLPKLMTSWHGRWPTVAADRAGMEAALRHTFYLVDNEDEELADDEVEASERQYNAAWAAKRRLVVSG